MKTKINLKYVVLQILIVLSVLFACIGFTACEDKNLPEKLATPQNLRVEGNTLVWDEVEYADGYSLLVKNEYSERLTKECACDLSDLSLTEKHLVKLMAYSNRGIANSDDAEFVFTGEGLRYTEGMEFSLNSRGELFVSKLAVDENGDCVIPAIYGGYKLEFFRTTEPKDSSGSGGIQKPIITPSTPQAACSRIKRLYLPYHLAAESEQRCVYFTNLEEIVLGDPLDSEEPDRYAVEGNCIIDKTENAVLLGCLGSTVPETVTKIGRYAFAGRNITSFTVPEQIEEIGYCAFYGCAMLETLNLPENLQMESFDIVAGCSSLKEIKIPYGVKSLSEAFSGCASLTEVAIPESVTNLDYVFMNCTSLKTCAVPKSVKKLEGTFKGCTALESVDISGVTELNTCPGSRTQTDIPTFYKCASLKEIKFGSALQKIEDYTFAFCSSLKEVSLPRGLTQIGAGAFSRCTALQSIEIPDTVTSFQSTLGGLGGSIFSGCTALKEVKLSSGVPHLFSVFRNCTALESVEIPDGVVAMIDVFKGCTALKSAVLPKQFEVISADAFQNCPLEAAYYRGTEAEWESVAANVKSAGVLSATRYYYTETAPALNEEGTAYAGNFWRYVNGVPTVWVYEI